MTRKIVSNINYDVGMVYSMGYDNRPADLFKKQGTLDGACATYSVIMNLLVLGVISDKDTEIGDHEYSDRKTKKLFKVFCEDYGMHRYGQSFTKIKKMLTESFSSVVTVKHRLTKGRDSVTEIINAIDDDTPVVMSIEFNPTSAHALLAIGYEEENGTIQKILCLDPSGEKPRGKRWNAEIGVARKRRFFDYTLIGDIIDSVELDDILIIKRK